MRINPYHDSTDDFWTHVDSSLATTISYVCACTSAPATHEGDCGTAGPGWTGTRESFGCIAMRSDRTKCRQTPVPEAPFCDTHMNKVANWVAARHPEAFMRMLDHAERDYVDAVMRTTQVVDLQAEIGALKSRVYFFGIGDDIVKIGRSLRPENRLTQIRQGSSLMPAGWDRKAAELLGTIPGGATTESKLHQLLRPWRIEGEWFRQSPEVTAVMAYLLGGEMSAEARAVFTESATRPWWVDEGFLTLDAAEEAMSA